MSSKKRLGRAMQLCHVWSHSRRFPSPAPLTHHLHLRAWQQGRGGERCGSGSFLGLCGSDRREKKKEKKRKNREKGGRRGYKTEGKRGESYFGQRRFGWPDFLGRYLWREQENYCLVSPSSEISPVAYCCSRLQEVCGYLIMYIPACGICNWLLRD